MGERDKIKDKQLRVICSPNVRLLIVRANELNIKKEDIVDTIVDEDQVYLIYYR